MSHQSEKIGNYILLQTLGSGSTSKVKLAQHCQTEELVAIKIIKKSHFAHKPNLEKKIHREIALMKLMDHPHILKLKEVLESSRHLHLVLEYAENGELFDYLVRSQSLQESEALNIFRQIIYGIDYLHSHSICHRDLKPENILIDGNGQIKIADFGFARWMKENIAETSCGSPHYAAPEVVRGVPYDGRRADIWSAGGYLPFDDPSIRSLLAKVKKGYFHMPDFHPNIKDLIRRMMTVDPDKRITIAEIKNHVAFRQGLPSTYVVPSPIPYADFSYPINPATIPPDVFGLLTKIGLTESEINSSLVIEENNPVKIFVMMLSRKVSYQDLPWECAVSQIIHDDFQDAPVEFTSDKGTFYQANLGRRRRRTTESPTPDGFSLAHAAPWAMNDPIMFGPNFESNEILGPANVPLVLLASQIQIVLNQLRYIFFHPNDMQIIAKNDKETYIVFDMYYCAPEAIDVHVQMIGCESQEDQDIIYQRIREVMAAGHE
ncbi:CAMK family protein kinase [Histomonas meleagridis]|uniref:CAMK family protein kinase n=1 Tax=Histomonas meleagridis TaxID=135588 RepID=UPI00355965E0|nr:CAMK family protein kinase [Histomonas meleagridis]KAH0803402.1 CAMK family protein kinase [Histomonas meleagridis]